MVLRKLIIGTSCFLLGALGLALAQGTGVLRPEVFITLPWAWSATQSSIPQPLTLSGSTYTPAAAAGNNITLTLDHTQCVSSGAGCTLANPSGTVAGGTSGVLEITESASGSDKIGTWGSSYITTGGVTAISIPTGASQTGTYSYYVRDTTHIIITTAALNATH